MSTVERKQAPVTPVVGTPEKTTPRAAEPQPAERRVAAEPQPAIAADAQALANDKGQRTTLGLPGQPGAAVAPVPPYDKTFGQAGYVKDGADANLLGLARRVAATSPELANGPFGQSAKNGVLSRDDVKTLQRHLESKGYSVGDTGVDGKYGPRTHRALAAFLAGDPPTKPADAARPGEAANPTDDDAPGDAANPGDAAKPGDAARPGDAAPPAGGPLEGAGMEKDGLHIPAGEGRATTFWNGHIAYKGKYDMNNRQNNGLGAWGDKNEPTDYFVALPVKDKRWHNQKILVTNPATGQQVVALVQDKGPHPRTGAKIDLSPVTMEAIGGHFRGDLKRVTFEFAPADAPLGPVRR